MCIPIFTHFPSVCQTKSSRWLHRCLQDFNLVKHGSPESSVSRKIFSDHWNVSQAPIPGNIMWDHLTVDPESWWARALIINILLLIFVMFVTTPSVLLTSFQEIEAAVRKFLHEIHAILFFIIYMTL